MAVDIETDLIVFYQLTLKCSRYASSINYGCSKLVQMREGLVDFIVKSLHMFVEMYLANIYF